MNVITAGARSERDAGITERPTDLRRARGGGQDMHPYHIKEYADERVATRLREARRHELLAEAQASLEPGQPVARRGARFRIPLINWELSMQPPRHAGAGR